MEILTTGMNPDGDNVGGSMAAVVRNTSQLPQADRAAMAAYIKSLAPVQSTIDGDFLARPRAAGAYPHVARPVVRPGFP